MSSSMSETYIEEMDRNDEDQPTIQNNVIELSEEIDGDKFVGNPWERPKDYVDFRSSFHETNIPTAPVSLTYDVESHLIRVKDSSQIGFEVRDHVYFRAQYPVISTQIAKHPLNVQIFAASSTRQMTPHQFYEVFLIPSKHSHACTEDTIGGFRKLHIHLTPDTGMSLCCDFIGIRTISEEILQTRFPGMSLKVIHRKKPKCFRIVFRTIFSDSRECFKLQMRSNIIYYISNEEAVPVMEMVSQNYYSAHGGRVLMIFGKHFTSEALVIFGYPTFNVAIKPCKEFLCGSHLSCIVPPCERQDIQEPVVIDLFVQCGAARSLPMKFTYIPNSVLCCTLCVDLLENQ